MSFSVDQFTQVKCKLRLTSESESAETIQSNNEQIRLCTWAELESNNSTLIAMVCSNEKSNNHILVYYMERRRNTQSVGQSPSSSSPCSPPPPPPPPPPPSSSASSSSEQQHERSHQQSIRGYNSTIQSLLSGNNNEINTSTRANKEQSPVSPVISQATRASGIGNSSSGSGSGSNTKRSNVRLKPKIIIKQIYYHDYNEDIVAICLSKTGTELVLISASSTIYILPIKNILLNLHAQQLRSSQGKSMYFYDASIINCSRSVVQPISIAYWESSSPSSSPPPPPPPPPSSSPQPPPASLSPPVLSPVSSPSSCQPATQPSSRSYIIVACKQGNRLVHISVDSKKEICVTSVSEPIKHIEVITDSFGYSLLITCQSFNQYRQTLERFQRQDLEAGNQDHHHHHHHEASTAGSKSSHSYNHNNHSRVIIDLAKATTTTTTLPNNRLGSGDCETNSSVRDELTAGLSSKPVPIKLNPGHSGANVVAASTFSRVLFTPVSRFGSQSSLLSAGFGDLRERPVSLIFSQSQNLIGVIDVLGANNQQNQQQQHQQQHQHSYNYQRQASLYNHDEHHYQRNQYSSGVQMRKYSPRVLRFYSSKLYNYGQQRPQAIYKLNSLDPDEMITHLVLTDRFIAFATDQDRCIINSRNCCRYKSQPMKIPIDLDPLIKEVTFNNEEKIMALLKSPITHDQDNILDSFILVTTRSIYVIDARHSCRDLYINLIDSHLAIKRTLFTPRLSITPLTSHDISWTTRAAAVTAAVATNLGQRHQQQQQQQMPLEANCVIDSTVPPSNHLNNTCNNHNASLAPQPQASSPSSIRSAESNLLINDFLQHRDVYEKICHDSLAFSTLFKLELSSLYEAYADRLLQRKQLELANRFFHLANFDHTKILGKYIRIGAYKETIDYIKNILSEEQDFRKILVESERAELTRLAAVAFDHLLAKFIIERSKLSARKAELKQQQQQQQQLKQQTTTNSDEPILQAIDNSNNGPSTCPTIGDTCVEAGDGSASTGGGNNGSFDTPPSSILFDDQQKQNVENIFLAFLTTCLDEPTGNSSKLWFNYINFYLNYVGNLQALEVDILKLIESSGDCRLAISLYKAIHHDESLKVNEGNANKEQKQHHQQPLTLITSKKSTSPIVNNNNGHNHNHDQSSNSRSIKRSLSMSVLTSTSLDSTGQEMHNLANLFDNGFLMRLLETTLDLLPQVADLDAIINSALC